MQIYLAELVQETWISGEYNPTQVYVTSDNIPQGGQIIVPSAGNVLLPDYTACPCDVGCGDL